MVDILEQDPKAKQEPKKPQGQDVPKPRDLSKIKTDDLMQEFANLKAKLEVSLNQAAAKKKEFPPLDKEEIDEAQKAQASLILREQNTLRKDMEAKKQDYRKNLETEYRVVEKLQNDPAEFEKAVEAKVKSFEQGVGGVAGKPQDKTAEPKEEQKDAVKKLKADNNDLLEKFNTVDKDVGMDLIEKAYKKLGWDWNDEAKNGYEDAMKNNAENLRKGVEAARERGYKKDGEEATEKKIRGIIETKYNERKKLQDDSKAFDAELEKVVGQLKEKVPNDKSMVSDVPIISDVIIDKKLLAELASVGADKMNVLWPDQVADKLSLPDYIKKANDRNVA